MLTFNLEKISYNMKTNGQIILQFRMVMYLLSAVSRIKVGIVDADLQR